MKKLFTLLLLLISIGLHAQTCGPGSKDSVCSYGPITIASGVTTSLPSNGGLVPGFQYIFSSGSGTVTLHGCIGPIATGCVTLDSYTGGTTVRTPDEFSVKAPSAPYQYYIVTPSFAAGTFTVLEVNNNTARASPIGGTGGIGNANYTGTQNVIPKGSATAHTLGDSSVTDAGIGVTVGSPTGGAQGAGTLNAIGLYINGSAVGSSLPSGAGVVRVDSSSGSAAELSGDVATSGSNAVTVSKINGTAFAGTTNDVVLFGASNTPKDSLGGTPTLNRAGLTFTPEPVPTAPTAALVTIGAQNCTAGAHTFAVMYVTANGRTNYGTASNSVTCDGTHTEAALTAIPTGTAVVTGRNICATKAGGSVYYIASAEPTIADNSTTTFTFNVADATLGTGVYVACPIGDNSTAGLVAKQWGVHVPFGSVIIGNEAGQIEFPIDAANVWTGGYPQWPYNTFVGTRAGRNNTPSTSAACATTFKQGTWNTLLGGDAGLGLITGCLNTIIGGDAVHDNDIGSENTCVGVDCLQSAAAAINQDTAEGVRSGANDTGGANTFLGYKAGQNNTSGTGATDVGWGAGGAATTALNRTAVGAGACAGALVTTTGDNNTCVGWGANPAGTGAQGVTVGSGAGHSFTTAPFNTLVGYNAGFSITSGTGNTCIGNQCLGTLTTSNYNTFLGYFNQSGTNALTSSICVGAYCATTASHQGVMGGHHANGYIDHLYLGEGVNFTTPQANMYVLATDSITTADQAATELDLGAGASTGVGQPQETCTLGTIIGTAGATAQTRVKRFCTGGYKALVSGVAKTVLSIPLATLQTTGGHVDYTIRAQDGTNNCSLSGTVYFSGENSAGVFVVSPIAAAGGIESTVCTVGNTLVDVWSLTGANPALLQVTATTTITITTMDITYSFWNSGMTDPTVY